MNVLAIIPARAGSKGIPNKNFKSLAGVWPVKRATRCALEVPGIDIVVSTDTSDLHSSDPRVRVLRRPAELAQDDTPMIAVVQHVLEQIPGPEDQIIVLVQPTQPLRQPKHLTAAIALLQETQANSVVSVVELPRTHSPRVQLQVRDGRLEAMHAHCPECGWSKHSATGLQSLAACRQSLEPTYIRDGTVYALWRKTVTRYGNIYGPDVRPLIIPARETQSLDSIEDWAEAERRLRERAAHTER